MTTWQEQKAGKRKLKEFLILLRMRKYALTTWQEQMDGKLKFTEFSSYCACANLRWPRGRSRWMGSSNLIYRVFNVTLHAVIEDDCDHVTGADGKLKQKEFWTGLAIKNPPKKTQKTHLKNPLKMFFFVFYFIFNFLWK
jgi:hypothetical protein